MARLRLLGLLDQLDARYGKPSAKLERAVAADAQRVFPARRGETSRENGARRAALHSGQRRDYGIAWTLAARESLVRWIVDHGGEVVVQTPVLAECTTGNDSRDAELNRVLAVLGRYGKSFQAPTESTAQLAGALRFSAGTDDGFGTLVAPEAAQDTRPAILLTSDPRDLGRLLARMPHVGVRRV